MKLLSVVPDLGRRGGIQEMARVVGKALPGGIDCREVNWAAAFPFSLKGFLKYLPSSVGASLYGRFFAGYFERVLKEIDADLVHFWHPEAALSAGSILRKGRPYTVTCLGLEVLPANLRGFRRSAYAEVLDRARLVHAISRYTRDLIVAELGVDPGKVRIINPPVGTGALSARPPARGPETVIGTLSRLQKRKNVPNTVRALELLWRQGLRFTYFLAGDGPDRRAILAQLKRVSFPWKYLGRISEQEKLDRFYPALDLFVMPPLDLPGEIEGFGIVYLEANAAGVPVVASRTGGVDDAVREGVSGEFADPGDPGDIAAVIVRVLENRESYRDPARRWAAQFSAAAAAEIFAGFYREAAGEVVR